MNDSVFVDEYKKFFKNIESPILNIKNEDDLNKKFIDITLNNDNLDFNNIINNNVSNSDNNISSDNKLFKSNKDNNQNINKNNNQNINKDNNKDKKNNNKTNLKQDIINYINSKDIESNYKKYLIKLAEKESGFNPNVINSEGFKGLFQFGDSTLKDVNMTSDEYMSDWKNQVDAAIKFTNLNRDRIRLINRGLNGRTIDNIPINEWGLLGASHLGGVGGLEKFLFNDYNAKDSNNTSIKDYLIYFSKI